MPAPASTPAGASRPHPVVELHGCPLAQVTTEPPEQLPAWHESSCVQAFPSLHAVPLVFSGFEQTPVAGLHEPAK